MSSSAWGVGTVREAGEGGHCDGRDDDGGVDRVGNRIGRDWLGSADSPLLLLHFHRIGGLGDNS
ncbi:hypothetical protein E2562_005489 [Oryza meyeriana var. granulata]|uniref:Uncharacterized protein n=1 Tax=Oryza meyeriana var. granulata TaxID=110450 RepID=A0A6G1DFE5_9ORYZ|nr:hypothetical protein E2562_005489 [Oryza meyeriana var. granulata]